MAGIVKAKKAAKNATMGKNELAQLVLGLTVPMEAMNIAMRDAYSAKPQARAGPFIKYDIPWNGLSGDTKTYAIPTNLALVILFRNPLRAWIAYDPNSTAANYGYNSCFGNNGAGLIGAQSLPNGVCTAIDANITGLSSSTTYQPHDDFLYGLSNDQGKKIVWIEGSATRATTITWNFQGSGTAPTVTGYIDMYNDNDGDDTFQARSVFTAQAMNAVFTAFTITDRDYRRFEITITAVGGTAPVVASFLFSVAGTSDCFGHHALPQLTQNRNSISGLKFLANACKWTNNSKILDKNGRIVGCQFSKSDSWRALTFNATTDPYTNVAGKQGAKDISYEKGGYGFLKPEEESDFSVQNCFEQGPVGWIDSDASARFAGFFVIVARAGLAGDTVSATDSGRIATVELFQKLSYSTKNIWLDSRVAEETPAQWSGAVEVVSTMEQFFPDPAIQWKTVLSTIGSLARLSAPLVSALGPYGRVAGTVLQGVGAGLGALGYRTKKTARPPKDEGGDPDEEEGGTKAIRLAPRESAPDVNPGEGMVLSEHSV